MTSTPRSPSRASSFTVASQDANVATQQAALLGASYAFKRPSPTSRLLSNGIQNNHSALSAALKAGNRTPGPHPDRNLKSLKHVGSTVEPEPAIQRRADGEQMSVIEIAKSVGLAPPEQARRTHSRSPSHTAALVAVARAAPARAEGTTITSHRPRAQTSKSTSKPPVAPKPRRLSEHHRSESSSIIEPPTDTTSIPSTTSLVSLFERKTQDPTSTKKQPDRIVIKPYKSLAIESPKPVRRSDGINSVFQMELDSAAQAQASPHVRARKGEKAELLVEPPQKEGLARSGGLTNQRDDNEDNRPRQSGPNKTEHGHSVGQGHSVHGGREERGEVREVGRGIETLKGGSEGGPRSQKGQIRVGPEASEKLKPPHLVDGQGGRSHTGAIAVNERFENSARNKPQALHTLDKPRSPNTSALHAQITPSSLRHIETRTSPIDIQPSVHRSYSHDLLTASSPSTKSIQAAYYQLYPKRMTPLTTGDELANAIVASSLASSRVASPHRREPPPAPPGRRHSYQRHFFHSRTPSPAKTGLRHTLRKEDSSGSESQDEMHPYSKHQKKRLIRKHPNKHHEGDRKRWRDAVTERERKRYEGVWAANKGLYCTPTLLELHVSHQHPASREGDDALDNQISNLVAKDIWSRSRLPTFELETVWDLVDTHAVGRLSKQEFVVGMWLIDQRLKGRKLPVKVTSTVWTSVRGLQGIKVRK